MNLLPRDEFENIPFETKESDSKSGEVFKEKNLIQQRINHSWMLISLVMFAPKDVSTRGDLKAHLEKIHIGKTYKFW